MCLNAQFWICSRYLRNSLIDWWLTSMSLEEGNGQVHEELLCNSEWRAFLLTYSSFLISVQRPQGKIWVRKLASEKSQWSMFVLQKRNNRELPNVMSSPLSLPVTMLINSTNEGMRGPLWNWTSQPTQASWRYNPRLWLASHGFCSYAAWREPVLLAWPLNDTS